MAEGRLSSWVMDHDDLLLGLIGLAPFIAAAVAERHEELERMAEPGNIAEQEARIRQLENLEELRTLADEINAFYKKCKAYPVMIGDEEITLDVDFWTQGRLTELCKIERPAKGSLTEEDLPKLNDRLRKAYAEMKKLPDQARDAYIEAQEHRQQACLAVYNALADKGWYLLEKSGFRDGDTRNPFDLWMKNGAGDVLRFTTIGTGRDYMEIAFRNVGNPELRDTMREQIRRTLEESGFVLEDILDVDKF